MILVVFQAPGWEHGWGHPTRRGDELVAVLARGWAALEDVGGSRCLQGGWVVLADPAVAVEVALRLARLELGVGCAVGTLVIADPPVGRPVVRAVQLAGRARAGEILVPREDNVEFPWPAGVGMAEAPQALAAELGPTIILRDMRDLA